MKYTNLTLSTFQASGVEFRKEEEDIESVEEAGGRFEPEITKKKRK